MTLDATTWLASRSLPPRLATSTQSGGLQRERDLELEPVPSHLSLRYNPLSLLHYYTALSSLPVSSLQYKSITYVISIVC